VTLSAESSAEKCNDEAKVRSDVFAFAATMKSVRGGRTPKSGRGRDKTQPNPLAVARLPTPLRATPASQDGPSCPAKRSDLQQYPRPPVHVVPTPPRPVAKPRVAAEKKSCPVLKKSFSDVGVPQRAIQARGPPVHVGRCVSSVPVASPISRSREVLKKQLIGRLEELRLRRKEVRPNKDIVNILSDIILLELKSKGDDRLYGWELMKSGSYYEKTKVCLRRYTLH